MREPGRRARGRRVRTRRVRGRRVKAHPGHRAEAYHARTLSGTLGLTTLGTLLPGSGLLLAGRRGLGLSVLLATLGLLGLAAYGATEQKKTLITAAVDPQVLLVAAGALLAVLLGLVTVAVVTYRTVRRPHASETHRALEAAFVSALCMVVAAPFVLGARYAFVQRDLLSTVFAGDQQAVAEHPWGADDRVNVLLLGGDGGVHRTGIRTDTVMLASMDADTGNTVVFGLPRNLQEVPFPEGSTLDRLYPHGFTGPGDPLEWMLNAVYRNVPAAHPHALDGVANEGAEAVKMAVSGALGIPVDYYVLINLRGFQEVVDAIGGITVNINQPIPIGGNSDLGIPPKDYLHPGPSQHLDGFEALWFARGRYGLDDYNRMARQRCVVDALIDEADPLNLLRRYEALADAGKEIVRTDIPQNLVPQFVDLALDLQDGDMRSVVFRYTARFNPNDPDFGWMRQKVRQSLAEDAGGAPTPAPAQRPGHGGSSAGAGSAAEPAGEPEPGAEPEASDPCGYHPVG
jgi:polyisoprenyl-teichoic acid--peptidoglycan teichoic acid transferase